MVNYDWKRAPEWARYAVINHSGTGVWHENEPVPDVNNGLWIQGVYKGDFQLMRETFPDHCEDWEDSLQKRPSRASIPLSDLSGEEVFAMPTPELRRFISLTQHWSRVAEEELDHRLGE